mmetsp:Transcript_33654/g.81436  ORF Transcript_33654/g.81436 Transcript_33654/m.81436 type:complete len:227 (+) Transcript_33654:431-1111(+)
MSPGLFLPSIVNSEEGYIVNTSSINGFWTWPEHSSYASAKFAVRGFTEALMADCMVGAPHVKVACVHPGGVKTNIANNRLPPPGEKMELRDKINEMFTEVCDLSAEEAADWILSGVARNKTRILVGYDAVLLDLMIRLGPRWSYEIWAAMGRQGVNPPERLRQEQQGLPPPDLSLGQSFRILAGGLWYPLLFVLPMEILKRRREWWFVPAVCSGVVAGAGALRSRL